MQPHGLKIVPVHLAVCLLLPVSIVMDDRKRSYPYVPGSRVPSVTVTPLLESVPLSVRRSSFQVKQVPFFFPYAA